jgi:hypothetical protein
MISSQSFHEDPEDSIPSRVKHKDTDPAAGRSLLFSWNFRKKSDWREQEGRLV